MKTATAMDSGVGVGGNHGADRMVYSDAPFLTYWEITQACDLACRHCRADAITQRDPQELTNSESKDLLKKIRGFGERAPHLVLTGGDPLKRPDFFDLLEYGASIGLHMSVAPSGTIALTRDVLKRFKATGVESISLSLDGSTAERHDNFRGVSGCFARTFEAAHLACEEGLGLQVNTLATEQTAAELPEIFRLVSQLGLMRWSVFFLIGVGRGQALKELTPERCESLHHWLYDSPLNDVNPSTTGSTIFLEKPPLPLRRLRPHTFAAWPTRECEQKGSHQQKFDRPLSEEGSE